MSTTDTRSMNDTRGPADPVLGGFVDVVAGEHEGRYGVLWSIAPNGEDAVVRTRDKFTDLLSVSLADLRPAEAGRR